MNDAAVEALRLPMALTVLAPLGGLSPELRERATRGVVRRGEVLTWADQQTLLLHGVAFALALSERVNTLDPPSPVRCILNANETNATFRFHQIRPGENWNLADLDGYRFDKLVVIDVEPGPDVQR